VRIREVRVTETVELSPLGELVPVIETTFALDTHGPFTVRIPKDQYSRERFLAEARKIAESLKELEGQEL